MCIITGYDVTGIVYKSLRSCIVSYVILVGLLSAYLPCYVVQLCYVRALG